MLVLAVAAYAVLVLALNGTVALREQQGKDVSRLMPLVHLTMVTSCVLLAICAVAILALESQGAP